MLASSGEAEKAQEKRERAVQDEEGLYLAWRRLLSLTMLPVSPETMDGRSIAPQIIDASDPKVLPSTRLHLGAWARLGFVLLPPVASV